MSHDEHNCSDPTCENHYAEFQPTPEPTVEYEEPKAAPSVAEQADKVLVDLKSRSFSGRHPELGKMMKCQVCNRRHRAVQKCEQKFVELFIEEDIETGEKTTVFATALQEGKKPTLKQHMGAAAFKGKRLKAHPNKRNKQLIDLVRSLIPDEYTPEDLTKAQKKARRMLAKKLGRHGFLPPLATSKKYEELSAQ